MDDKKQFDFWYAVTNTKIHLVPSAQLETFGNTILNYYLVAELMDSVNKVRVREGRLQAFKPTIITPVAYAKNILEGFGEEAKEYIEWLRLNEKNMRILQYGYTLKQESFSDSIINDSLEAVLERVLEDVKKKGDPLAAVLQGVDSPWDVCLVKLFWEVATRSVEKNIMELHKHKMLEEIDGLPKAVRIQIEEAFQEAEKNPSLLKDLAHLLQINDVFEQYQDRFFSLHRRISRGSRT